MCECVNAIVGLMGMVERGELWNRKGSPRDRRGVPSALPTRIAVLWRRLGRQGSLTFGLKISDLQFCMIHTRNALIFNGYVITTKKAQRRHEEGRKNA